MVDVQIGRLQRKIEKLQKQRDHYKSELAHYQHVIAMQPFLMSRYKDYEKEKVERRDEVLKETIEYAKTLPWELPEMAINHTPEPTEPYLSYMTNHFDSWYRG